MAHILLSLFQAVLGKVKKVNVCDSKDNERVLPDHSFDSFVPTKPVEPSMSITDAFNHSNVSGNIAYCLVCLILNTR